MFFTDFAKFKIKTNTKNLKYFALYRGPINIDN